jgi:DNA (cytosine-5)-methyltransferase 1
MTQQASLTLVNERPNRKANKKSIQTARIDAPLFHHNVISMFSGAGGMDLGFRGGFDFLNTHYVRNPFNIVWANELNPYACKTYRHNLDTNIYEGDVWEHFDSLPSQADVIIGGFPCQDISVNGKGLGLQGERSSLYRAMVAAVAKVRPRIFVVENVRALTHDNHADTFETITSDFARQGYIVTHSLYNAANYGVPQTRERVFIVGRLPETRLFTPPAPTHSKENWITAQQAMRDLEGLDRNPQINHIWSAANVSPDQGNRRLIADRAGYTVRAECHGNSHFHYALPRRMSMRESARIQSFPDNFVFQAGLRETERQVGNAVPPVLAWHIAQAVAESLRGQDSI